MGVMFGHFYTKLHFNLRSISTGLSNVITQKLVPIYQLLDFLDSFVEYRRFARVAREFEGSTTGLFHGFMIYGLLIS